MEHATFSKFRRCIDVQLTFPTWMWYVPYMNVASTLIQGTSNKTHSANIVKKPHWFGAGVPYINVACSLNECGMSLKIGNTAPSANVGNVPHRCRANVTYMNVACSPHECGMSLKTGSTTYSAKSRNTPHSSRANALHECGMFHNFTP